MLRLLITLPRQAKQLALLMLDVMLVPPALAAALALQVNTLQPATVATLGWQAMAVLMAMAGLLAFVMSLHRVQLKAYEQRAMAMTAFHAGVLALAFLALDRAAHVGTPLATFVNFALVYFLFGVLVRLMLFQILVAIYRRGQNVVRVVIYGAGRTGQQLAAALRTDDLIIPVAFIDDNPALQSSMVAGLHVYPPLAVGNLINDRQVSRVLLAMPSVPRPQLAQISRRLEDLGLDVQALPSFAELAGSGDALLRQLAPVMPDRFLGRAPLDAELPGGADTYEGKSVLVTGAGGSIGSELCRQLLACRPRRLVLFEISELALYTIDLELRALAERTGIEVVAALGSVADAPVVRRLLTRHGVEIVIHAAAYKHVPIVEHNAAAGISNNVLGTHALAVAAAECGVQRFILISSDKAVRPKNLMGASKRLAEIVVQDLASRMAPGGTVFSMVRFGNVMGSSGSVIPLFQDQIAKGGPVTLTHREVTRFFMTIPEAARLVLVAGTFAHGGDVFVLDMGDPIPIYDLARQMIEAQGYRVKDAENPTGDIEIVLTGLRPGEKLHEELLIGEGQMTTPHPKILQAREDHLSEIEVAACLKALRAALAEADDDALRAVVARWVEGGKNLLPRGEAGSGQRPA